MTRGSGVDDDDVEGGAGIDDGQNREQLVDARRGEIHQLRGTGRDAASLDANRRGNLGERLFEPPASLGERARRVQLADDQIRRRAANRPRGVADVHSEDVAK